MFSFFFHPIFFSLCDTTTTIRRIQVKGSVIHILSGRKPPQESARLWKQSCPRCCPLFREDRQSWAGNLAFWQMWHHSVMWKGHDCARKARISVCSFEQAPELLTSRLSGTSFNCLQTEFFALLKTHIHALNLLLKNESSGDLFPIWSLENWQFY